MGILGEGWKMPRFSLGSSGDFHTGAPAPPYSVPVRGPSGDRGGVGPGVCDTGQRQEAAVG